MPDQPQQHGAGGVDLAGVRAYVREHGDGLSTALLIEVERLQSQVEQLTEERQRERGVGTLEHARQHVSCGVENPVLDAFRRRFVRNPEVSELTPFGFFEAGWSESGQEIERLRARCASLEAVAEAAKGIALRQSPAHQALRQALAAASDVPGQHEEGHPR